MKKVFLIGAARSGTKMLRDIIATHPDIAKVPFDINFVWKYSNENISHDALTPQHVNRDNKKFIEKYFQKLAADKPVLIEKTVSNTLRVNFILSIFPDAKFIYLIRDGRDVVESVNRQWGKAPKNNYLVDKIKSFPLSKSLTYGFGYGMDLIKIKLLGKPSSNYVWGVKYPNYEQDLKNDSILVFCAKQWKHCIDICEQQIQDVPPDNLLNLRYEDFVMNPQKNLENIADFLSISPSFSNEKLTTISTENIGKGFERLIDTQKENILNIIHPTLTKLGYQ